MEVPLIRNHYMLTQMIGGWYGVVIMTRIPMRDLYFFKMPTGMDRVALVGCWLLNGEEVPPSLLLLFILTIVCTSDANCERSLGELEQCREEIETIGTYSRKLENKSQCIHSG
jgi:hypothetical protein